MKVGVLTYAAAIVSAVLIASVLVLRDFDVPLYWSIWISTAAASWLALMLWASANQRNRVPGQTASKSAYPERRRSSSSAIRS